MGKTTTYVLIILQQLQSNEQVGAVVLVPSPELAVQTKSMFERFATHLPGVDVDAFYVGSHGHGRRNSLLGRRTAGVSAEKIEDESSGDPFAVFSTKLLSPTTETARPAASGAKFPAIVVGSPSRIKALLAKGLSLTSVKHLVVDECDRLLQPDTIDAVRSVFKAAPAQKQVLMFSTTLGAATKAAAVEFTSNPYYCSIEGEEAQTPVGLAQFYTEVQTPSKFGALVSLLGDGKRSGTASFTKAIVFVNSDFRCSELVEWCRQKTAFAIEMAHGGMPVKERLRSVAAFRDGTARMVLVTTDFLARGIDVGEVDLVVNYELPAVRPRDEVELAEYLAENAKEICRLAKMPGSRVVAGDDAEGNFADSPGPQAFARSVMSACGPLRRSTAAGRLPDGDLLSMYIHRVGRAARFGRKGQARSFVTIEDGQEEAHTELRSFLLKHATKFDSGTSRVENWLAHQHALAGAQGGAAACHA